MFFHGFARIGRHGVESFAQIVPELATLPSNPFATTKRVDADGVVGVAKLVGDTTSYLNQNGFSDTPVDVKYMKGHS